MALTPGQKLRRREPASDIWDDVVVTGYFDLGPDGGGFEVVLSPAIGFASPIIAQAASILKVYTLDVDGPPEIPEMPWETPAEEVTA